MINLQGPIGREFVEAIRDLFPDLREANLEQIAEHMRTYGPEQLMGVMNEIKGKFFERLVAHYENSDDDQWRRFYMRMRAIPAPTSSS